MGVSAKPAAPKRKDKVLLGPILCQQCRALVSWERQPDRSLLLVSWRSKRRHVCRGRAA